MSRADRYLRRLVSSQTFRPDGSVSTSHDLAVWTLRTAVTAAADASTSGCTRPAMLPCSQAPTSPCRPEADVLQRYEHTHPDSHLLRVQAAFLQPDDAR